MTLPYPTQRIGYPNDIKASYFSTALATMTRYSLLNLLVAVIFNLTLYLYRYGSLVCCLSQVIRLRGKDVDRSFCYQDAMVLSHLPTSFQQYPYLGLDNWMHFEKSFVIYKLTAAKPSSFCRVAISSSAPGEKDFLFRIEILPVMT